MNVFDRALDIIRSRGMCKFRLEDDEGHVCLYGAMLEAAPHVLYYASNEVAHLDRVAARLYPERAGDHAPAVNNHRDTTQEDVELILKHASYEWDMLHA